MLKTSPFPIYKPEFPVWELRGRLYKKLPSGIVVPLKVVD